MKNSFQKYLVVLASFMLGSALAQDSKDDLIKNQVQLAAKSAATPKDVYLSMVYSNAIKDALPFEILSKGKWTPDPESKYVKLHLYFDEAVNAARVELDTCKKDLIKGKNFPLSMFVNFDQWILQTGSWEGESGGPGAIVPEEGSGSRVNLPLSNYEESFADLRSLTFNFEKNRDFSVCGITLKDAAGEEYKLHVPKVVSGEVKASSTLSPASAYDAVYLFDSRFEYGWASDKKASGVTLDFSFQEKQHIESLRIWNGYQRSPLHCYSNSRAKTIRITGDNGYDVKVSVKDELGSQVVKLPKPFDGKNLKFSIDESYKGKAYVDLVISELRFGDGKGWFLLDPSRKLKEVRESNVSAFKKAGLAKAFHESYVSDLASAERPPTLRLRQDGSFYYSVTTMPRESEDAISSYFTLGNYEIKEQDAEKGLLLRFFGLMYESKNYGDCNGCGRDCSTKDSSGGQKIFQAQAWLKSSGDTFTLTPHEPKKSKFKFHAGLYKIEASQ